VAEPLLVVGLGNPGPDYAKTRHNLGFVVADILADRIGSGFKVHKRSGAEVATGRIAGRSVVLAKPRVYMNESGRQVGPLSKFYSVPPADVVIIHDELDIDFGKALACWAGHAGCAPSELAARFVREEAYRHHEVGKIEDAAYFETLRASLGIGISDAQFLEGWNAIFTGEMPGIAPLLKREVMESISSGLERTPGPRIGIILSGGNVDLRALPFH